VSQGYDDDRLFAEEIIRNRQLHHGPCVVQRHVAQPLS